MEYNEMMTDKFNEITSVLDGMDAQDITIILATVAIDVSSQLEADVSEVIDAVEKTAIYIQEV